jgi:hypothetical protein
MENVEIFYDIWSHFKANLYILCPFGKFCGDVVYFLLHWHVVPTKTNLATMVDDDIYFLNYLKKNILRPMLLFLIETYKQFKTYNET